LNTITSWASGNITTGALAKKLGVSSSGVDSSSYTTSKYTSDSSAFEAKIDPLFTINGEIKALENNLSNVEKTSKRVGDSGKITSIGEEIAAINPIITALGTKITNLSGENGLIDTTASFLTGKGFIVDKATGLISNYKGKMEEWETWVNSATTEDERKKRQDEFSKIEEEVKNWESYNSELVQAQENL
jgi:hypothetical protein